MHNHDPDLMAAYAAGAASADEAVAAEHALEICSECTAEYSAQVEVLQILRSAPTASMTDIERAALHRALAQATQTAPPQLGWFSRNGLRIAAVAAGFAVVGLASVAMLGQLEGDRAETTASDTTGENVSDESLRYGLTDAQQSSPGARRPASVTDMTSADTTAESADDGTAEMAVEAPTSPTTTAYAYYAPLEMTAADLEELATLGVPEEIRPGHEVEPEFITGLCGEHLPDPLQLEVAVGVLFEGQSAFVVVYTTADKTVAAAVSQEDCTILAEYISTP